MSPVDHPLLARLPVGVPRPRKNPSDLRSSRIVMRVSPRERTLLESRAAERGCTLSALMRAAIRQVPGPRVERDLVVQIRRIGILLNQAIKHLHQGLPAEDDLQAVLQNLRSDVVEILRRLA